MHIAIEIPTLFSVCIGSDATIGVDTGQLSVQRMKIKHEKGRHIRRASRARVSVLVIQWYTMSVLLFYGGRERQILVLGYSSKHKLNRFRKMRQEVSEHKDVLFSNAGTILGGCLDYVQNKDGFYG